MIVPFNLSLIEVFQSPFPLLRLGNAQGEGGYVIAEIPSEDKDGPYDVFLSGGIRDDISFEEDFVKKFPSLICHAFDGSIEKLPRPNEKIKFYKKFISAVEDRQSTNLKRFFTKNDKIFVKMDIEGFEAEWLLSLTAEEIDQISQMVVEFHPNNFEDVQKCLRILKSSHNLVHFHGVNFDFYDVVEGQVVPKLFELTFLNKKFGQILPFNEEPFPKWGLDSPDLLSARLDFSLSGYPFTKKGGKVPKKTFQSPFYVADPKKSTALNLQRKHDFLCCVLPNSFEPRRFLDEFGNVKMKFFSLKNFRKGDEISQIPFGDIFPLTFKKTEKFSKNLLKTLNFLDFLSLRQNQNGDFFPFFQIPKEQNHNFYFLQEGLFENFTKEIEETFYNPAVLEIRKEMKILENLALAKSEFFNFDALKFSYKRARQILGDFYSPNLEVVQRAPEDVANCFLTENFTLVATRKISIGSEILISAGKISNLEFFLKFGQFKKTNFGPKIQLENLELHLSGDFENLTKKINENFPPEKRMAAAENLRKICEDFLKTLQNKKFEFLGNFENEKSFYTEMVNSFYEEERVLRSCRNFS